MTRALIPTTAVLALLLTVRPLAAAPVDYIREVKPLLMARCSGCHGGLQQKGGLRLDTVKLIQKGGKSGAAVVPRSANDSLLITRVTAAQGTPRMPPASQGEALTEKEIALLRAWIDQGAAGPADEKPEADPRDHWAFRAPVRPTVPRVKDTARVGNPIDAFLAAEWEKRGLTPQPAAEKRVLLRRLYLDLIGLPPTAEELEAFLADTSPKAYEQVVDKLLASPRYGERWGRHWMDIWRYSDWWGLGAEVRNSQKHIWHWRDWIIESLNADKGYDQMLREMLAADELYPNNLDKLRATGFLARQYFKFNRNTWLDETVEHTSKAFLGLTLNCARCHDHKYDPITQADYYRFRAFFEPYQIRTDQVRGEVDFEKDGIPRAFDCNLDAPTYLFVRGDEKHPVKDKPLSPGLPVIFSFTELETRSISLPPEAYAPGLRPLVIENYERVSEKQLKAAQDALAQARKKLADADKSQAEQAQAAVSLAEKALATAEAQQTALQARIAADHARYQQPPATDAGDLARKAAMAERQATLAQAEENLARAEMELLHAASDKNADAEKKRNAARDAVAAARKALEAPGDAYTPLRGSLKTLESNVESEESRNKPFPTTSTGRRTALAQWLTDKRHPLTARVAVNDIWARHFGQPLVATVFDFGRKGSAPPHPALLDYLAVELTEHDWSMKHLHRLIVTSNAYRLSSSNAGAARANLTADAENHYYWRMNPVRMESEVVRDSLLHLAGEVDLTTGGPSLDPVKDEASRRRSLYFVHSHNDEHKFLAIFDDANVLECYRRAESIVPQQALALTNSKFSLTMAAKINDRLHERWKKATDAEFVRAAFETILATVPTADEQAECEMALAQLTELLQKQQVQDAPRRARRDLIQALLNHNDFITVR
jgi:hypothetical protein